MGAAEISGFAVLCAIMIILLREWRPAMAAPIRLGAVLLMLTAAIGLLGPIALRVRSLLALSDSDALSAPILRATGVALITELAASFCRDLGERGVADGVLLFGRLEILLLCLPLIDKLIDIAGELLA